MKNSTAIIIGISLAFMPIPMLAYGDDPPTDEEQTNDPSEESTENIIPDNPPAETVPTDAPEHKITIAPWPADHIIKADLTTTEGNIECSLYAGDHPLTVLNFISLAKGNPAWTDATGKAHKTPYFDNLPFSSRVKGAYVKSGLRPEGTDFVIADERCKVHPPTAGAILMVQPYPGMSSVQFALMARDNPTFTGMYTVFGKCGPLEVIDKLTRADAILQSVTIK